ncbi:MAG: hypothetical protein ACXWUG_16340 [Polyangiales bacterium]
MRRKLSPRPEPRASSVRPVLPASPGSSVYGSVLAQARRLGLLAVVTIAPLGALAGTVSACGGAAPVRANPYEASQSPVPPMQTITPPPAAASATPPAQAPQAGQTE